MLRAIQILIFFYSFPLLGQFSGEKTTMSRMGKGQWQKVEQSLRKSIAKDILNPEARYLMAVYFFTDGNQSFNLDSAHRYSLQAWKDFTLSPLKDQERFRKNQLDSALIFRLTSRIDSAAFERAKRLNTEASYQDFLDRYENSVHRASAIELRDEVAFLDALRVNIWSAFQKFMEKYPKSLRKADAQKRFDRLLYEDKTSDQRLSSFIRFYEQNPESPYRVSAENSIYELATASGSISSFQWIVSEYPDGSSAKKAKNLLYELESAGEEDAFNPSWKTDSLESVERMNDTYWVPFYKSGKYGFMDEHGVEIFAPTWDGISDDYRCGEVKDKVLITSSGLITRSGAVLWNGPVIDAKEIGLGYMIVSVDSGNYVIHESGFRFPKIKIEDAKLVALNFISVKRNGKWALLSLAGKTLSPFLFDQVDYYDSLIVLSKNGKKILSTPHRIGHSLGKINEDFVFDDVRRWGDQQFWIRNGSLEGVIDARLNFVIPMDRQVLSKLSAGFVSGKDDKVYVKGIEPFQNRPFQSVTEQGGWIRLQSGKHDALLVDKTLNKSYPGDSVWFQSQVAFLQTLDSIHVFLPSGQRLSFISQSFFQLRESGDSSAWLIIEEKKKKVVIDGASGVRLFSMDMDQLEPLGQDLFLITRQNKKGIVSEHGKVLVPVEYDAIVGTGNNSYSLLKDKKFGWFDARTATLIKPAFDRNIRFYSDRHRIAYKDKGYAFIYSDGKPMGNFEWEDIQYWNDSTALGKRNFQWMLFDIHTQKIILDKIRSFTVVSESAAEKVIIARQDNAFGVVSSKRGVFIPLQYSDILNLGSREVPLYFTERHIEEAGISIVIYYDLHGKIIRKQAMEADEFEKIYCDQ